MAFQCGPGRRRGTRCRANRSRSCPEWRIARSSDGPSTNWKRYQVSLADRSGVLQWPRPSLSLFRSGAAPMIKRAIALHQTTFDFASTDCGCATAIGRPRRASRSSRPPGFDVHRASAQSMCTRGPLRLRQRPPHLRRRSRQSSERAIAPLKWARAPRRNGTNGSRRAELSGGGAHP